MGIQPKDQRTLAGVPRKETHRKVEETRSADPSHCTVSPAAQLGQRHILQQRVMCTVTLSFVLCLCWMLAFLLSLLLVHMCTWCACTQEGGHNICTIHSYIYITTCALILVGLIMSFTYYVVCALSMMK